MVSTSENKSTQLVWYITGEQQLSSPLNGADAHTTGTSSGLGKRLVTVLLNRGDKVIASARCIAKLQDFPKSENLRLQQLDVTDGPETMRQKAEEAVSWFGRIDVLVNNAGTGQKGILEEAGYVVFPFCYLRMFGLRVCRSCDYEKVTGTQKTV